MMDGYNHTWLVRISLYVFYVKRWNIKRVLKKKKKSSVSKRWIFY